MKGGAEKCMADDKVLMELAAIRRRLQGGPVVVNTPPEGGAMEATPQYRPSRDPQYPSFQPPMGSQYIYIPSRRQYQPNATSHSYYRAHEEHPTQQYLTQQYPTQQYPTQQYPTQQYPIQQYPAAYGSRPGQTFYGPDVIAIVRLDELKLEFSEDVDLVLNGNMAIFIKKLDVQKRQLVLELTAVVKTQSDRVIKAVDAGPHDRVVDPVRLRFFFVMPSFAHEITRIFARYGRIWWEKSDAIVAFILEAWFLGIAGKCQSSNLRGRRTYLFHRAIPRYRSPPGISYIRHSERHTGFPEGTGSR